MGTSGNLSTRKKFAFASLSVIAGCVSALALAEVGLRLLGIGYGNAPLESHPILHHVHPKNYSFLSHTPSNEYGGFHVYYGPDRRRVSWSEWHSSNLLRSEHTCRVAFLGDSVTEAGQVSFEESYVGLIAQHSACEVRNYGVASYSPVFYLTQWRHEVRDFRPTLVVLQLYSNDISGDADSIKIARLDSEELPTAIPGPPTDLVTTILRRSYVARLTRMAYLKAQWWLSQADQPVQVVGGLVEEQPDISALSSKLIRALQKEVESNGGELALMVVPSKYRLRYPSAHQETPEFADKWKRWSHENRLNSFVDMVPDFQRCNSPNGSAFFPMDVHFNAKGHWIVAAALCHQLQQKLGISADCATAFRLSCDSS
jgi:hypothetical protein